MIELKELTPRPPERYPPATDDQVRKTIESKIDLILKSINKPIRCIPMTDPQLLFEIRGGVERSILRDDKRKVVGEVEYQRLQELGLEIMKSYGLDPNYSFLDERPPAELANGTTKEIRFFPGRYYHGLMFQRDHIYTTDSKKPVYIAWRALDKATDLRFEVFGAIYSLFRH